jgi:hypothetical protein
MDRPSAGILERILRRLFKHKEIGWHDLGEWFIRYTVFSCRHFTIYLHQLDAPAWHPECHDHPWSFLTVLLSGGYLEQVGGRKYRRLPGEILFRPAKFSHNVITPYGTSWSLVITGPKKRQWGFQKCGE